MGGADFRVSKGVIDIRGLSAGLAGSVGGVVLPAGGGTGTGGRLATGTGGADFPGANGASEILGLSPDGGAAPGGGTGGRLTGIGGADFFVSKGVIDIRGLSAGFGASADVAGAAGGVVAPGGGAGTGAAVPAGSGAGIGGRLTGIGGADFFVSKGVIDIRGLRRGLSASAGGVSAGGGDAGGATGAAGTGGVCPAGGAAGWGGDGCPGAPAVLSFSFGRGSWGGVSSLMCRPCTKIPPGRNQKDALAVSPPIRQETNPSMTQKRLLPAVLLGALVITAGCHLFHHQKAAPELPPAAGVESEFRDRWIDKRVHDLTAANPNLTEADARQTADAEFAKQFPYVSLPAPKPAR